jgi:predicted kinase
VENKVLIIVAGPPCTGKTTLGRKIAEHFLLPFVNKDDIKESLFDSLGTKDRTWSKQLGIAGIKLLYQFIESNLKAGCSIVAENNFKPEYDTEKFHNLIVRYGFTPLQVQCQTNGDVLLARFKQRSESGERHPGHVDHLNYAEFEADLLKGSYQPLEIGGEVIYLDTTDFSKINYDGLYKIIGSKLGS